jgi:hypothetical protein
VRYWYRFLRFLGYRWYDAADATWTPVTGVSGSFFFTATDTYLAHPIDWTSDTIKVSLWDERLWGDWRWVD